MSQWTEYLIENQREALAALLKGREMDMDVLLDIADTSGMSVYVLIDEGIVIEYESNFYEGEVGK